MLFQTIHAWSETSSILWERMDFWDFVLLTISIFVLAAWIFSVVFILWWGLLLILSWWKDDKIKPAINTIRYSVIGIVATVLTIFLFPILWWLLWLDVEQYAQPKRIFEKISEIWNNIFWNKVSYKTWIDTNINDIEDFPADFSDL